jgi:hypothetical protein
MGRTLAELGQSMTAEEFQLHLELEIRRNKRNEPIDPNQELFQ